MMETMCGEKWNTNDYIHSVKNGDIKVCASLVLIFAYIVESVQFNFYPNTFKE